MEGQRKGEGRGKGEGKGWPPLFGSSLHPCTSASDITVHTNKFCFILFGVQKIKTCNACCHTSIEVCLQLCLQH